MQCRTTTTSTLHSVVDPGEAGKKRSPPHRLTHCSLHKPSYLSVAFLQNQLTFSRYWRSAKPSRGSFGFHRHFKSVPFLAWFPVFSRDMQRSAIFHSSALLKNLLASSPIAFAKSATVYIVRQKYLYNM